MQNGLLAGDKGKPCLGSPFTEYWVSEADFLLKTAKLLLNWVLTDNAIFKKTPLQYIRFPTFPYKTCLSRNLKRALYLVLSWIYRKCIQFTLRFLKTFLYNVGGFCEILPSGSQWTFRMRLCIWIPPPFRNVFSDYHPETVKNPL